MSISVAIVPCFSNPKNLQVLNDNEKKPSLKPLFTVETANPFDLQYPIDEHLRYKLFQASISKTVDDINDALMSDYSYYIDLTHLGKIHPSFIRHYAETVIQALEVSNDWFLPVRWEDLHLGTGIRDIEAETLSWD